MGNLIVVIVLMLGIVAIAQLMRVYELSAKLRGKKEEEISNSDNVLNARLMLTFLIVFYIFFFWLLAEYGDGGIGLSASEHGRDLDWMMTFNWVLLFIMFFVTTTLLFWFAYRYHYRPGTRAHWFPHNNKLELLWTSVPAAVLAVIITYGLVMWNDIMYNDDKGKVVELYAKQFDWTARYAGKDNKLGAANFRMINAEYNPLGILTNESSERRIDEIRNDVINCAITYYRDTKDASIVKELEPKAMKDAKVDYIDVLKKKIEELNKLPYEVSTQHVSDKKLTEARAKLDILQRHILKLISLATVTKADKKLEAAADDDIIAKELHMVKGVTYHFQFRSQDVIHSAFLPHFRAQMNCVPGMVTTFSFKPIMTTQEMREHKKDPKFDYVLLCNKICGATHYKMKMAVYVYETEKEMEEWLKTQKTFASMMGLEEKPNDTAELTEGK
jgi:cytochrome c oxidase subunit 2